MKRVLCAALSVSCLFLLPSSVAAANATCSFDLGTHQVTVTISGDNSPQLYRGPTGPIYMNGTWCGGAATVTNTDKIVITGDVASNGLFLALINGGFKPGFTNESGTSDEIEFSINMGGGSSDTVTITGTDKPDKIDLGQDNSQLLTVRKINLNAGESTAVDADMTLVNVERLTVVTYEGADVVRGRGKAGSGPDPINLPMTIYGGPQNDVIKGGEAGDTLVGNENKDKIWGFAGSDIIDLHDGAGGDVGYGGINNDTVNMDSGDIWHPN